MVTFELLKIARYWLRKINIYWKEHPFEDCCPARLPARLQLAAGTYELRSRQSRIRIQEPMHLMNVRIK